MMNPVLLLLCSPLIILAVHMVLTRISGHASAQTTAFKAVMFGYLPTGLLLHFYAFGSDQSPFEWIYCFLVYSSLGYTYFHFFNMSETARRIRILYEIHRLGTLSAGDITGLYRKSDIIDNRLKRLTDMKQLRFENGYYIIDKRTLYWAALIVSFWRGLLKLDRMET